MTGDKGIFGRIEKIPDESKFNKYLLEMKNKKTENIEKDIDGIEESSKNIFEDCGLFINSKGFTFPPTQLMLIYTNEDYLDLEEKFNENSIVREPAIGPSLGFIVHNKLRAIAYVNMNRLLNF
ncbi:MAG: hypothetical protein WAM95_17280 [Bacillus sp. (in: firmicutes)]